MSRFAGFAYYRSFAYAELSGTPDLGEMMNVGCRKARAIMSLRFGIV